MVLMQYTSPTRPKRRWFLPAVILVIVGLVVWRFLPAGGPPAGGMGGATPVSVAEVISKPVTQWKEFSGRLEAVDTADVRARVSGTIEKIYFKDGDFVKKGAPLFLIDPRPYQAAVAQAEGQLASAEAELATANIESTRARKLMAANAIARTVFEERTARAKTAAGSVRAAKGTLDAARLNLHYTLVTAPISGKASRAELTVGNLVNSEPVLTRIVQPSPLYVGFEADEQTYLSMIRVPSTRGLEVEMGLANEEGTPHKGTISSFDNQLDPSSGTIRGRAVFDNADGTLVPGLFARIRIGTPDTAPSVLVNEKAISTDQSSKYVLAVDAESKAAFRPVTLGGSVDGLRVVTSGLKPGEQIIVNGIARVRPGAPVTPIKADMVTLEPLEKPAAAAPAAGAK